MNINQATQFLADLYFIQQDTGERFSVELRSGPGMGKDACVEQAGAIISKRLGLPFSIKSFFLTTVEAPDVRGFGLPGRDTDGSAIMQFTKAPWVPRANDAKHGFVFLNERAQAEKDVSKPSAELLLNGQVGESRLEITYMVVAASNRESDRSGVNRDLAFIQNRICVIYIEPSLDSWVDWAERNAINPFAIAFAKVKPSLIFADKVPDKQGPFCTPRTFVKTSHLINRLSMEMFTEAAAGYIGEGAAAEFVAFLRVAEELPKWEDIVAAPDKVKIPEHRIDATYAAMQMVAHRVDAQTAKPAFVFLKRLGKEFQVAGLKAVLRRCPQMIQTPDFAQWIRDNKDLVLAANILEQRK